MWLGGYSSHQHTFFRSPHHAQQLQFFGPQHVQNGGGRKPFRRSALSKLLLEHLEDRTMPAITTLPDLYAVSGSGPYQGTSVLTNDLNSSQAALTASLQAAPMFGTAIVNSDGTFTYTPNTGYSGPDTFLYTATDGSESAIGAVTLNVATTTTNVPNPIPGSTTAYAAYLSAVDQANQSYLATISTALPGAQGLVASAQASAHAAYLSYLSTLQTAYQSFLSSRDVAAQSYDLAATSALAVLQTSEAAALSAFEDAIASADFAYADSALMAGDAHQAVVDGATSAYNATVGPFQLARDAAAAALQADPNNTSLQSALAAAEQALADTVAVATIVRDASILLADGVRVSALNAASQIRANAIQAAVTNYPLNLQAALAAFNSSESSAWAAAQAAGNTAKIAFLSAEQTAWTAYLGEVDSANVSLAASMQSMSANPVFATALATWQASELAAWNMYLTALNAPGGVALPEARVLQAPALPGFVAMALAPETRDPAGYVGTPSVAELIRRNRIAAAAATAAAAAATAALITTGIVIVNAASSAAAIASMRQAIMAEIAGAAGAQAPPSRGTFQYTGNVRALADAQSGVNLDAIANRLQTELEARGFTNVTIEAPVAFIRFSVARPQTNPREGACNFSVAFRVRVTGTPAGGGARITEEMSAGTVVGDFLDIRLEGMIFRP